MNMAFIAAIVLFITQQIDGNFIQPRLMSGSFSLSPLLVIVSITIGGAFAGVLGMIAAIPIVAVLKDLLDGILVHHEWRKLERGERIERQE
jgi:predicted PurR-regulated permease PerM